MNKSGKRAVFSAAREIAYTAVMCALLIGVQFVLSFVAGVELVTLVLACYSSVFGVRRGVMLAASFSLLRCLIFGFMPNVVLLYLVYYPIFACIFGLLGHIKQSAFERYSVRLLVSVNIIAAAIAAACALLFFFDAITVSRLIKGTVNVMLWVIFGLSCALLVAFDILFAIGKSGKNVAVAIRLLFYATTAAVCTIFFTLLDDVISPLMLRYTPEVALAYFYTSFTSMLSQTACAIVSVCALYMPLELLFKRVAR